MIQQVDLQSCCRCLNECGREHAICHRTVRRNQGCPFTQLRPDLNCIIEFHSAEVAQIVEALDAVAGGLPDNGAGVAEHHAVGANRGRRRRHSADSGYCMHMRDCEKKQSHARAFSAICNPPQASLLHGHARKHISGVLRAAPASTAVCWYWWMQEQV